MPDLQDGKGIIGKVSNGRNAKTFAACFELQLVAKNGGIREDFCAARFNRQYVFNW